MSKVVKNIGGALGFGGESAVKDAGKSQAAGVRDQINYLKGAENRAAERLQPFVDIGTQAIPEYQALLDPNNRFDAVMSNPLVSGALDAIGQQTGASFASGGKFNSGGMANALFGQNFNLLNQLGQQELGNYLTPVQLGQSSAAGSAANTLNSGSQIGNAFSNIGDIQAATTLGRQNASAQLGDNLLQAGGAALKFFSDRQFKRNIVKVGEDEYGNLYEFDYIWGGRYRGRMADELREIVPDAVIELDGALLVTDEFAPTRIEEAA
jgi:hypothetical protein